MAISYTQHVATNTYKSRVEYLILSEPAPSGVLMIVIHGGDTASTWDTKPFGACRGADYLVNTPAKLIVANNDNYALAA